MVKEEPKNHNATPILPTPKPHNLFLLDKGCMQSIANNYRLVNIYYNAHEQHIQKFYQSLLCRNAVMQWNMPENTYLMTLM